jgi:hypothetical protein
MSESKFLYIYEIQMTFFIPPHWYFVSFVWSVRFIKYEDRYKTCTGIVSFEELNSALAAVDELQHTLVLGRRVEIHFNRFRNVGRQWVTNTAVNREGEERDCRDDDIQPNVSNHSNNEDGTSRSQNDRYLH